VGGMLQCVLESLVISQTLQAYLTAPATVCLRLLHSYVRASFERTQDKAAKMATQQGRPSPRPAAGDLREVNGVVLAEEHWDTVQKLLRDCTRPTLSSQQRISAAPLPLAATRFLGCTRVSGGANFRPREAVSCCPCPSPASRCILRGDSGMASRRPAFAPYPENAADRTNADAPVALPPPPAAATLKRVPVKQHAHQAQAPVPTVAAKKTRKRALAETTDSGCIEQLVTKAKCAIKRRCAEMGIRRYASLSSMSAKHANDAGRKPDDVADRLTHKCPSGPRKYPEFSAPDSESTDPASDATIILLPSEDDAPEDDILDVFECLAKPAPAADSIALESQITLVAPSSPPPLAAHSDSSLFACAPLPPLKPLVLAPTPADDKDLPSTYEALAEWLFAVEQKYSLGLECGMARHPELSSRMRPILVDWLMEVSTDYRMHRQTLHLTVQYLD
ncbi:hypothetical protein GGH92_009395, partial [Coemansia sp. RSA 2673]